GVVRRVPADHGRCAERSSPEATEDCGKFAYGRHRRVPRRTEKSVLGFRRSGESPSWAGNNRLRHGRSPGQRKLLPGAASVASRKGGTADPADGWWASGTWSGRPCLLGTGRSARGAPQPYDEDIKHTSELQSRENLVCRLLLEKKNMNTCK